MTQDLIHKLLQLADIHCQGFTVEIDKHSGVISQCNRHSGYVVSVKTLVVIDYNDGGCCPFICYQYNNQDLDDDHLIIGGWYDAEDHKYYIEKNIIVKNKPDAIIIAMDNNQKAIFDIKNNCCVAIPTTPL